MSRISRSSVNLDVAPGEGRSPRVLDDEAPFRILIAGDFSGRDSRGVHGSLSGRRPQLVDRDNIDDVIAGMRPQLRLPGLTVEFSELDDFDPDRIYRRSDIFQELAEQKVRPLPAPPPPARPARTGGGSLLDDLVEESGEAPVLAPDQGGGDLAEFIRKIVAPHLVQPEDPRMKEQAARADEAAAAALRGVLHHPHFQALEAAWRSVDMLVRGLDTDENLKVYLYDATLPELVSDLAGTVGLFTSKDKPWAVIVGNYPFGQSDVEAKVLGQLGRIAQAAGAPFLAEALPPAEASPEWKALRQSAQAKWIGLILPRFLVRLPYGKNTSPIESFPFEEMPKSVHEDYLWGNPAFCAAMLLGQSFLAEGWDMHPGSRREIGGLPLHVYDDGGEPAMKPCAEILMSEKNAHLLMEEGIMPLASMKEQDAVLLVRFQSIADPVAALGGGWRG